MCSGQQRPGNQKEEFKRSARTQVSAWVCFCWTLTEARMKDAHHSIGHSVAVHPHLGVHVDQVPSEGFTLQPLPQRLPVRHVANINTRVLAHAHTHTHIQKCVWSITDCGEVQQIMGIWRMLFSHLLWIWKAEGLIFLTLLLHYTGKLWERMTLITTGRLI